MTRMSSSDLPARLRGTGEIWSPTWERRLMPLSSSPWSSPVWSSPSADETVPTGDVEGELHAAPYAATATTSNNDQLLVPMATSFSVSRQSKLRRRARAVPTGRPVDCDVSLRVQGLSMDRLHWKLWTGIVDCP